MQGQSGLSRREVLKRGAALGGSLIWAAPTVQAIGMSPAFAQDASPRCNVYYAVKIDPTAEGGCEDIYAQRGGPGKCLDVVGTASGAGFTVSPGGCGRIAGMNTAGDDWTVTLAAGCQLWDDAVGIKTGGGSACLGSPTWDYDAATRTITFFTPGGPGSGISHVEFIFCCSS